MILHPYPIVFIPILKEKIWGGNKLQTTLNKKSSTKNLGESWEISAVSENVSVVENGALAGQNLLEILSTYQAQLVGKKNYDRFKNNFPLLIKYIDACKPLSVQLHPSDEQALEKHNSYGKTEMWYIMESESDAEVIVGFNGKVDRETYQSKLAEGNLSDILHYEKAQKGDGFFIEPGTIHAIGAGVMLAEIQQNSDITYRVYDYDRVDASGRKRALHTKEALESIDFSASDSYKLVYDRKENASNTIKRCSYFTTNFVPVTEKYSRNIKKLDSFAIYMIVQGIVEIRVSDISIKLSAGESTLIPAVAKDVQIQNLTAGDSAELLEIYIE